MTKPSLPEKIKMFRELHQQPSTFILPNAWNAISAKMFQESGFQAIGTTSAGIAISLGYPDGQQLPVDKMVEVTKSIVDAVDVPVSADIEAGYGKTVEEVLETVKKVMAVGVIGINIEDGTNNPEQPIADLPFQTEVIKAIRELSNSTGSPLFINARTDYFWLNIGNDVEKLYNSVQRAKAYEEAGADCIFIPGVSDVEAIKKLRKEISKPINLLAGPSMPSVAELSELKIDRLSCGSGLFRAIATFIKALSDELMHNQTFHKMNDGTLTYKDIAKFMQK